MSEPAAYVHADLDGIAHRCGRLWFSAAKGRERASFEYEAAWLRSDLRFSLEPALTLGEGQFHTDGRSALFGALGDSAPDRWGRTLLRRAERRRAQAEGRAPRTLFEIDYLLGVSDEARQGALRFTVREGGPFVATGEGERIPPLVALPHLLAASDRLEADEESDEELRLLLAPGSSLGGARPKASVRDHDGHLLVAKFPARADDVDVVRWEAVALALAARSGVAVPPCRLERAGGRSVFLVRRFDRRGPARLPFLSAMSMLGAADRELRSYVEIAEALLTWGAEPTLDLRELWRRVVFSVLISNTDDHLRNHAFLHDGARGWRLSPAYDLNPVPIDVKPRILSTAIGPDGDPTASLTIAMEVAEFFGVPPAEARRIAGEVGRAVSGWRAVARQREIGGAEIDRMASAFEHADLAAAVRMG